MSWIVANWRLKLLALALTLGLLAAVAFSENPVAAVGVPAAVDYDNLPQGMVVVNPVLHTQVTVVGLASVTDPLRNANPPAVRFHVNLAGAKPTSSRTFYASPKSLPSGVSWTGDQVPITVGIDTLETRQLRIEARPSSVDPGFKVVDTYAYCSNPAEKCQVTVTAPHADLQDLTAYVEAGKVNAIQIDSPTQPVRFERAGKPVDPTKLSTFPPVGIVPSTVNVRVTAQQTQASRQVALRPTVNGRPACGYAITGISFAPDAFATATGPADRLSTLDSVNLPTPIDVTGATANVRVNESIPTDGYTVSPTSVTVTVSISRQVDCSAPTPTPAPAPTPTPTKSP